MEHENLQKLALIAEIVGGLAIVLSLIFVGLEIRQSAQETALNTRALEVSAYQDLVGRTTALSYEQLTDRDVADLVRLSIQGQYPQDDVVLTQQFNALLTYVRRHADLSFYQYINGLISEEQFLQLSNTFFIHLRSEFGRNAWERFTDSNLYSTEFVNYVENHMRKIQPSDLYWQNR